MKKSESISLLLGILFVLATSANSAVAQEPSANDESTLSHVEAHHGSDPPHPADPHGNLAEAATNPISNLIQVQLQDQVGFNNYESSSSSNVFIVQPVIPFKLPWKKVPLLITRTTATYVTTQKLRGSGRHDGFGDILNLSLFLPKLKTKGVMVGVGPAISFPVASSDYTGSDKWSAGPAAIYFNLQKKGLQWGVLSWYLSSFAGSSRRDHVSKLSFQPVLVKHFAKGWYLGSPDVPGTYNFRTSKWTYPIGPRLGRVFKIGKQPINLFGETWYSPLNDGPTAKWSAKISLTLLFPK
jgi:hypothetical protein